ncbi:hypothetical protein, partial [Serratia marcescens]
IKTITNLSDTNCLEIQGASLSGYNHINLEHLPPELKQVALQIVQNQFDRDTAEKKLAELIQQLEFDITAAELSAYLFKPGHA